MDGVAELTPGDLDHSLERREAAWRDAHTLAIHLVQGTARSLQAGEQRSATFLIRTPIAVEAAIRSILEEELGVGVRLGWIQIEPKPMSLNPDLYFEGLNAIGDVKYRYLGSQWPRDVLYQAVTFAVGAHVTNALVVSFGRSHGEEPIPTAQIGDIRVANVQWPALSHLSSEDAYEVFAHAGRDWSIQVQASTPLVA